nr:ANTAR domain-containing protein [bacterium]
MSLETRILLIDDSAERVVFLNRILNECGYEYVTSCAPTDIILDHVSKFNPEVILIDVFSPSRDTLEQLTTIRDANPRPVVLLSQDDNMQTIEAAFKCGVTAYVSRDVTRAQAKPIIDTAMITFASFQSLKNELDEVREELQQKKIVEKAKGILMSDHDLSEEDAYQRLRKFAMDRKRSMSDVANQIIEIKKLTI